MNLKRIVFLGIAALGVMACDEKGDVIVAPQQNFAYVRFINAVNDTLPIDFHPVDKVENGFVAIAFRDLTQYRSFAAGSRQFRAFPNSDDVATTSSVLQDVTLSLTAGRYYTVLMAGSARAAAGSGSEDKITLIEEADTVSPTGANIKVRLMNAALGTTIDAFKVATTSTAPSGSPTIANVAFGALSTYVQAATGSFAIRATTAGTTTVLASIAAPDGSTPTVGVDPIPGATIGGSRMTAIYYPASVAGSKAAQFASPGVVVITDNNVHQ